MDCITRITGDIINDCLNAPIEGVEQRMYVMYRPDVTFTKSLSNKALITGITSLNVAFKVVGFKKSSNTKTALVSTDTLPDTYTQSIDFTIWSKDAATMANVSAMNELVIVVENKDKGLTGESAFEVFGVDSGLFKTALTSESNTDAGVIKVTMAAEGQKVAKYKFLHTDYATSKADLEALLVP
jgi:hypothetical protein